ncbi:leucine--tRNA ligase [Candidatus Woesearchaeota archaeon]|nr:leucine--tRNA ligase [Candidatus Woesearchaeota archaeon]
MALEWAKIQEKWQKQWAKAGLGKATAQSAKEKFFMIFAYPGISGFLHVGHMRGFSYTDAICRYERLKGKEVLFPIGTHASGNQAIAFANKVKKKDTAWIEYLRRNGCPEEKIKELTDPHKIIEYFNTVYVEDYWKKFGFLCDWDRFTCTTYPDYEKFIQWQFKKLLQKNLLIQKPYFATACVVDGPVAVDPSETDISKGGNAEKQEFTLLKFKLGNMYLIAATLRPETIYGQTNLWINPSAKYVHLQVDGEDWIASDEAAAKLPYQKDNVLLMEDVDPMTLIGKTVLAPGVEQEIPVLPATFCDPAVGTGIVTSVPADAPKDYVALRHLQLHPEECRKYGLDPEEIRSIQLVPIIITKGYGKFPAAEIVEKMNITSLDDPQLEEATKEVYKAGFHTGILRENCGKYAGMSVEQAKELIKEELIEFGRATVFHDLSEEVICRCGNKVVIKRIDDQWFIRYSDSELTEKSKRHAREMKTFPDDYQENLPHILDWFEDRACARLGNWLGSKFPFDTQWTVEPISDSTLYPAYYIVSKFIQTKKIKTQELTEAFFDYVFLGLGEGKEHWSEIKKEFDYFYPLDLNLGGKEHKTVHFPVFIMNHVAVFPQSKWPRGIFVNWWVTGKGSKISKSKGGAEPIPDAIEKYGVDAMRLYYAHVGSPHVDVVWTEELVLNYKNTLERIYALVEQVKESRGVQKHIDDWLLSRAYGHLQKINSAMKHYDLRELASIAYFAMYDDVRWYVRRGGAHRPTIEKVLSLWNQLLNPITPHLSEELNSQMNKQSKRLVSSALWPEVESERISLTAEAGEELVKSAMEGIRNVKRLANIDKPQRVTLFVAEKWLYGIFSVLHKEINVTRNVGEVMKRVMEVEGATARGKDVNKIVLSMLKDVSKIPMIVTSQEDELAVMNDAKEFLEAEFGCTVGIIAADDSDHLKAKSAIPGKIGIVVE